MKNYLSSLENVTSFKQLLELRMSILSDIDLLCNKFESDICSSNLSELSNAQFFLKLVNKRIEFLCSKGFTVDQIVV